MFKFTVIKISLTFIVLQMCLNASAQNNNEAELLKLLSDIRGNASVKISRFNHDDVSGQWSFRNNTIVDSTRKWRLQFNANKIQGEQSALDGELHIKLEEGFAPASSASLNFNFAQWSRENYVLVPAIVYNGNRYQSIGDGYNPPYPGSMYYNPRVPLTISNNPRLAIEKNKASLLELQTGNAATPAMCFFSPKKKKAFIILTQQQTQWGNNGLTIAENAAQDSCLFSINIPAVRKLAPGFGDFHKSGDKAPDWKAGDEVTLRFRVYVFDASDIPSVLKKFMEVRKTVTGANQPRNQLPMSALLNMATGICSNNWRTFPVGSYYLPENSKDFQLGWVSGMMNSYPMLALNNEVERNRVTQELDFVVNKLQGKSGFFYGGITADGEIRPEKMNPDYSAAQAMVRKNSDALLWLLKHLMLLKEQGYASLIKKEWEQSARSLAQAFVNTWKKYGEFGQYIVPENGEIAVFNSTAGAIAPAGLAIASAYFHEPEFLQIAAASATYYYERDVVKQGLTGGDCGDISQDANSESAFGFLESLMALYYFTGDQKWIEMAKVEAALCATWTLSYDPVFPANSDIGKLQCNMAGAMWASIQNKHAAPGICTASGDYLFKLYRATGNELYADLIRDIQHAHAEAVNRPEHLTTHNLIGSSMERIQPSDAEGKSSIGNFINTRNSWTETNGMLMALELPGIYLQTDQKKLYVFDHVTAKIVSSDASGTTLAVNNPTAYDASVSIFAETKAMSQKPLSYTAFTKWPKVLVKAGGKVIVHIDSKAAVSYQQ
ncbi:hypothetical protein QTN47_18620 [Danxiaibacter flavus]|uniref:Uncharacterized protein n=1 Tax=Danxiaibacter flavus TaxID=3049108 RepID=A0ABV3ZI15_9BACT|nr:hypothetical protein QNM32_18630 [Chitinophagaceae bacterium DXS]